jgi:hypothetical protein
MTIKICDVHYNITRITTLNSDAECRYTEYAGCRGIPCEALPCAYPATIVHYDCKKFKIHAKAAIMFHLSRLGNFQISLS